MLPYGLMGVYSKALRSSHTWHVDVSARSLSSEHVIIFCSRQSVAARDGTSGHTMQRSLVLQVLHKLLLVDLSCNVTLTCQHKQKLSRTELTSKKGTNLGRNLKEQNQIPLNTPNVQKKIQFSFFA